MELWRKTFQISIDAYYAGDLQRGAEACEALLSSHLLPPEVELRTRGNLVFYAKPLNDLLPGVETWPLHFPMSHGQRLGYPSIASGDNQLRMLVCPSPGAASLHLQGTVGPLRPTFYLIDLASDLDIRDVRAILEEEPPPGPAGTTTAGEAARLFHYAGTWWICTSGSELGAEALGHVALLRVDGDATSHRQQFLIDSSQRVFRHWMPAASEGDDTLRFVASMSPVRLQCYLGANGISLAGTYLGSPLLRWCRGGTQLLRLGGGWLGVVHEAIDLEGGHAHLHRFVWLGADWSLARISPPWVFQSPGAEVAGGIALRGDELIISYGRDEHDAWLAISPLADVMRLLAAPLDPDSALQRLRREAAIAVEAGELPAPAQPAPVSATSEAQAQAADNVGIATSGDLAAPQLILPTQQAQAAASPEPTIHDRETFSRNLPEPAEDVKGYSRLAEALVAAGRLDEAITAFRTSAGLAEGAEAEMGAWAMYRAAECLLTVGRPVDAVEALTFGMARHAGLGELPWLAAYASWQANRPAQAAYWARRAIAMGRFAGSRDEAPRDESRHPAALWEGPFDILRFALRRLGDDAGADEAESLFQEARSARTGII